MATPIKDTPILRGSDARRFEQEIRLNESRAVPVEEYRRAAENYRRIYDATVAANDGTPPTWL